MVRYFEFQRSSVMDQIGEGLLGLLDANECWRLQLTEVIGLLYKTGKS